MDIANAIAAAWHDVESAYSKGYLVNESMMAFVIWKALTSKMPDVQITYDARILADQRFRPDLVVWRDGDEPCVLFVGELKFVPDGYPVYEGDIAKLDSIRECEALDVLTRCPATGQLTERRIPCAEDFSFGFFVVGRGDAVAVDFDAVIAGINPAGRSRFHFAIGTVSGLENSPSRFRYYEPEPNSWGSINDDAQ